jgi:hypothetical protein
MAIEASAILPSDSLEELRVQFNNLVTDVDGITGGNSFVSSIIFEGSTADANETVLLATDPTADRVITIPDVTGTLITTGNSADATTTTSVGDVDHILVNDGGVLKKITAANLGVGATAADNISIGDAAVSIATSVGNITIDAQAGDTDIIFKGTDGASDITALTLDMSDAGKAIFTGAISATTITLSADGGVVVPDNGNIGSASSTAAIQIASTGIVTFVDDIVLKDAATIGVASSTSAITIASTGIVTLVDDLILKDAATIGVTSSTSAISIASTGIVTFVDDILIKDGGTIGAASATTAITIASTGIVTLVDDLILKDAATIGVTSSTSAISIASTGIVTFVDDIIIKDAGTIGSASVPAAISISSTGLVNLATAAATVNSLAIKTAGKESIWVPAAAMYPSTTNPCSDIQQVETTALRPDLKCLDFDTGADEFAQFAVAFPKSWNEGTVTFQPFWTVTGTNTGTVAWQLGGIAMSSDDTINTAFGTLVATTALAHSGTSNDLMVSVESGAVTIGGSPAAADCCFFQINRDVSADSQSGDARLLGIKLFFTTDAANDA